MRNATHIPVVFFFLQVLFFIAKTGLADRSDNYLGSVRTNEISLDKFSTTPLASLLDRTDYEVRRPDSLLLLKAGNRHEPEIENRRKSKHAPVEPKTVPGYWSLDIASAKKLNTNVRRLKENEAIKHTQWQASNKSKTARGFNHQLKASRRRIDSWSSQRSADPRSGYYSALDRGRIQGKGFGIPGRRNQWFSRRPMNAKGIRRVKRQNNSQKRRFFLRGHHTHAWRGRPKVSGNHKRGRRSWKAGSMRPKGNRLCARSHAQFKKQGRHHKHRPIGRSYHHGRRLHVRSRNQKRLSHWPVGHKRRNLHCDESKTESKWSLINSW